jgi:enamine deaminase RidA (YjgF/YER057c/UK114 family)
VTIRRAAGWPHLPYNTAFCRHVVEVTSSTDTGERYAYIIEAMRKDNTQYNTHTSSPSHQTNNIHNSILADIVATQCRSLAPIHHLPPKSSHPKLIMFGRTAALSLTRLSTARRPCTISRLFASKGVQRIGTDDPRMSKVVVHNGVVYMSGQTDTTSTDITGQTQNVLAKIDDLLAQAGTSKSNLLTANIWLKDIEGDFKEMNVSWSDWLDPENKPVRATVQSPMARPQILVEIQVSAIVGDDEDK